MDPFLTAQVTSAMPSDLTSLSNPTYVAQQNEAQIQKFEGMFNGDGPLVASEQSSHSLSVIGQVAEEQDALLRHSMQNVASVMDNMPNMSIQQMHAASMQVSMDMMMTSFNMQGKLAVVDGAKKSVETLFRNQ
ncbi:MAG: type III secretion inner rod protein HrpB2 [Glomeribacter sp. 1016415]|uniref:Type III secretion protein HrpB2 n=1 Tax=Mycoavidus cysteinexigens TaxID=1553431 RepID=A0A2Z6EX25_9BURK|nr:hypothetical protein [Mycoavidus cysteinexigens]MCX8566631.1 type III secretion inner rod protein HrpB2 [Glomeribacter sp. 1016415]BBE09908.1 Type III secretion protein HrpB2 [Mycoavidus cysteinexigens]GAM53747.1 hypothetical protein EBME_2210 [bacterium endosymbiont of Mortierella elongata FMR23-6]GLR00348.1 hypothetical protein GCM10007934_01590 [Mycoavidus cysteinexigens]